MNRIVVWYYQGICNFFNSMENFEKQKISAFEQAAKKSKEQGFFSLTSEDHKALGSTPDEELEGNFGKSQYEIMSDEEIESYLSEAIDTINENNENLRKNGYIDIQKNFLRVGIPFLKSVGRLPEKFNDFDLNSIL